MIAYLSSGHETGCSILHSLELGEKMVRNSVEQTISIVKARYHVSMHHHLCGFPIQKISNSAKTVEIKICHMLYMALYTYIVCCLIDVWRNEQQRLSL